MALLEARNIFKRYGQIAALEDVSIAFSPGEIHAVLGENGAGKSTLMGVLAGFVKPDRGITLLDGRPLPLGKPFESRRLGIGMIHQHFTLVPEFTVSENLALARLDSLTRPLNSRALAQPGLEIAKRLGWEFDSGAKARSLPVGAQQRVEILKELARDAKVLIFDEPTAALTLTEVQDLFRVLRKLRDEGKAIVLIAHKLSEVLAVADRVTVLRKGRWIGSKQTSETNELELAEWMVGALPPGLQKDAKRGLERGLRVENLGVRGDRSEEAVRSVSFRIDRGEILGIGGVDGNGQIELAEALAGVRACRGLIELQGEEIAYIPQDRQVDGLALTMSVKDNLTIGKLIGVFVNRRAAASRAKSLVERFDVRVGSIDDPAGSLSGGNQQKLVVARELERTPDLLVALNPSRGLDIRATEFVHRSILDARDQGAAVALFSTDLDELAALSTRTLFMSSGRLAEASGATALVGGTE